MDLHAAHAATGNVCTVSGMPCSEKALGHTVTWYLKHIFMHTRLPTFHYTARIAEVHVLQHCAK